MPDSSAVKRLHDGCEEGSARRRVGEFIEGTKVEVLILCLVACDIVLLGLEHGIDRHLLCFGGEVVPVAPGPLVGLAEKHAERAGGLVQTPPGFLRIAGVPAKGAGAAFLATDGPAEGGHGPGARRAALAHGVEEAAQTSKVVSTHVQGGSMAILNPGHEPGAEEHHSEPAHGAHGGHGGHGHHGGGGHGQEHHHHHPSEALVCETREGHEPHHILHFCHVCSLLILVIFLAEILTKIWVNAADFFSNPWEVLDLVIVVLSLILDTAHPFLQDLHKEEAEAAVIGLLFCRFWRVVRIVHGVVNIVHHEAEDQEKLRERIKELEAELAEARGEAKPPPQEAS